MALLVAVLGATQACTKCVPNTIVLDLSITDPSPDSEAYGIVVVGPETENGTPVDCDLVFGELERTYQWSSPCGTLGAPCCVPESGCLVHLVHEFDGDLLPPTWVSIRARGRSPAVFVGALGGSPTEMTSFGCMRVEPVEDGTLVDLALGRVVPRLLFLEPTAVPAGGYVELGMTTFHNIETFYLGGELAEVAAGGILVPALTPGTYDVWGEGYGATTNALPLEVTP